MTRHPPYLDDRDSPIYTSFKAKYGSVRCGSSAGSAGLKGLLLKMAFGVLGVIDPSVAEPEILFRGVFNSDRDRKRLSSCSRTCSDQRYSGYISYKKGDEESHAKKPVALGCYVTHLLIMQFDRIVECVLAE